VTYQTTFKRHEIKYLLTKRQKEDVLCAMKPYMKPDKYSNTTIRNIYFDTGTFRLIRRSLEKPMYKEKLRIRSYKRVKPDEPVFVELKKKFDSVVYKRRIALAESQVMDSFMNREHLPVCTQIGDEIEYFRQYYDDLKPVVFLSYQREAYSALEEKGFRVTFDENILYRNEDISLCSDVYGKSIIKDGETLMEIKVSGGMPLWMSHILAENSLFKTSFSKYGTAYKDLIKSSSEMGGLLYVQ